MNKELQPVIWVHVNGKPKLVPFKDWNLYADEKVIGLITETEDKLSLKIKQKDYNRLKKELKN